MKKLSLKKLDLKASDLLQTEQLKTVFGGYGGSDCYGGGLPAIISYTCPDGTFAGNYTVCSEHYQAMMDMLWDFCVG